MLDTARGHEGGYEQSEQLADRHDVELGIISSHTLIYSRENTWVCDASETKFHSCVTLEKSASHKIPGVLLFIRAIKYELVFGASKLMLHRVWISARETTFNC